MSTGHLNALWCRAIAQELAHVAGQAVLCPGSRNAPLLYALDAQFGVRALSHIDERSGAFMALGGARTGRPALLCVTSGSALHHAAPAVAEAAASGAGLIVVAADRPRELHGCRAPQTADQLRAVAEWTRIIDLPEPIADDRALRSLRARIARLADVRGPVLINVPLREPLMPEAGDAPNWPGLSALARDGRPEGASYAHRPPGSIERHGAPRGVITAGYGCQPASVARLANLTGHPILADAASGMRGRNDLRIVAHADAIIAGSPDGLRPDIIWQCGDVPMSRAVYEWLDDCAAQGSQWVGGEEDGVDRDWLARASFVLTPAFWAMQKIERHQPTEEQHRYNACWNSADARIAQRLPALMRDEPWGEVLAAHLVCAACDAGVRLMAANSMAVRHVNLHLRTGLDCIANRGLNGIDGQLATAVGLARSGTTPVWLLTGDVAALHDLPALHALRQAGGSGAIIVLDNGGGGIFDFLPVSRHAAYAERVRTPTVVDWAALAQAFGLGFHGCRDRAALEAALAGSRRPGWRLIVCDVRGSDTVARHRALLAALAKP